MSTASNAGAATVDATPADIAWNQQWRAPLRAALDWLRDRLAPIFESRLQEYVRDPWATRDDYIRVILDRSEETRRAFFADHAIRPLEPHEQVTALKLLEMQRHALLMYTSCGWFFDELSGLETTQVIHYAGRALQLAEQVSGEKIEPEFLQHLANAKSNLPEHGDGAKIYEKWVKPAVIDIERVGGHYAISSLFESYPDKTRIYCYEVERARYSVEAEGKIRLATGCARFRSAITEESAALDFSVLHLGDHNVTAGIRSADDLFRRRSKETGRRFRPGRHRGSNPFARPGIRQEGILSTSTLPRRAEKDYEPHFERVPEFGSGCVPHRLRRPCSSNSLPQWPGNTGTERPEVGCSDRSE